MNILVTGPTGFIGENLIRYLKIENVIHVLVRPSTDMSKLDTYCTFVFEDNIMQLAQYMECHQIEGIVHLASLYIPQHKQEDVKALCLSNVYLGTAILEAAKIARVKWFLNAGTIWQNYIPDSSSYCPVNLYAATKQAFIDMAKYYTETSNIHFCTLKLCDTYGLGDTRDKIFTLFKRIAETGEVLNMSPGEQEMDIIHIDDVVSGFSALIKMLHNNEIIEDEYILSSGKRRALKELAFMYEKSSGKKLRINWGGRPYREREVMEPWKMGQILPGWKISIKDIML